VAFIQFIAIVDLKSEHEDLIIINVSVARQQTQGSGRSAATSKTHEKIIKQKY